MSPILFDRLEKAVRISKSREYISSKSELNLKVYHFIVDNGKLKDGHFNVQIKVF